MRFYQSRLDLASGFRPTAARFLGPAVLPLGSISMRLFKTAEVMSREMVDALRANDIAAVVVNAEPGEITPDANIRFVSGWPELKP